MAEQASRLAEESARRNQEQIQQQEFNRQITDQQRRWWQHQNDGSDQTPTPTWGTIISVIVFLAFMGLIAWFAIAVILPSWNSR
jgi:hypothetical protein